MRRKTFALARCVHASHPGLPCSPPAYGDDLLNGAAAEFRVISKPYGPAIQAETVAASLSPNQL